MKLRDATVLARCKVDGTLDARGGRVEIKYAAGAPRSYQAAAANLTQLEGALIPDDEVSAISEAPSVSQSPKKRKSSNSALPSEPPATAAAEGEVVAYADGACSGNPGPAGLGVVLMEGAVVSELSEYLGTATNNIAELTAILRVVERVDSNKRRIRIYTDSNYSIGVLKGGWKAKANVELIATIRERLRAYSTLELIHVRGHAGIELNERADELARHAVELRATVGWSTASKAL